MEHGPGTVKIKVMSDHRWQTPGWYLEAHRWCNEDQRSDLPTYAMVHQTCKNCKGEWSLEGLEEIPPWRKRARSDDAPEFAAVKYHGISVEEASALDVMLQL